ncbi:Ubiquitin carboxyl-terminal hydrolase 7 [Babesia sp. Xinjiang]|uniref:Ubiquitin carboxyl-terminal hydrolase 7 n=1 Tax=Babesia sp. Xinjiang TaxID=462227 RepID=UPI000A21B3DF|nr:Ubiquitin carboxyl-terminal hydrolase 7 [Babesia sp. Xinjiang]ORM39947.1 Ubiquitin carboxyl-terminal hydrolase 7 [Babesia sp. Xinjiang]
MGDSGSTIRVQVKWMGKQFNDLELNLDAPLELFKAQMFSLTGVPPDRQKLMYKGLLSDSVDLRKTALCNGAKIMMIGTAEKLVERDEPVRFYEFISAEERSEIFKSVKTRRIPIGLVNLGNTCYFNAVFQFLLPVRDLWDSIDLLSARETVDSKQDQYKFARSLVEMRHNLPNTLSRYIPMAQIQLLRKVNPLFSRTDESTGLHLQQDAEECLSCILNCINGLGDAKITDNVFGYTLSTTIRRKDPPEGQSSTPVGGVLQERNIKLNCYMGTQLTSVGTLMDGIMLSLNEELMKFNADAGCDVLHEKVSRISELPKYLIVHLVRFEWKQESEVSKTNAVKAKVCRRVNFERELDITPICTEEVKPLLNAANAIVMRKDFDLKESQDGGPFKGYEMYPGKYATGRYELEAVVTHQGRSADGGHYVCWTKDQREASTGDTDESEDAKPSGDGWLMFDDDTVTEYRWGSFDLCGGRSDFHIAVLLLYKAQCVPVAPELSAPEGTTEEPVCAPPLAPSSDAEAPVSADAPESAVTEEEQDNSNEPNEEKSPEQVDDSNEEGQRSKRRSPPRESGNSQEKLKFFVGGLHPTVDEGVLTDHFSKYGNILSVQVMRDAATGRSRGFGFVTVAPQENTHTVFTDDHSLNGKRVDVRHMQNDPNSTMKRKIFVGGISKGLSEQMLEDYFSRFGAIDRVTIMRQIDGSSRGFGFIIFSSDGSTEKVLESPSHFVYGSKVDVRAAESRMKQAHHRYESQYKSLGPHGYKQGDMAKARMHMGPPNFPPHGPSHKMPVGGPLPVAGYDPQLLQQQMLYQHYAMQTHYAYYAQQSGLQPPPSDPSRYVPQRPTYFGNQPNSQNNIARSYRSKPY